MPRTEQIRAANIYVNIGDCRLDFLGDGYLLAANPVGRSPLHLHTRPELQYIVSGPISETVQESLELSLPQDSILLIPPNMLHSNEPQEGTRVVFTFALQQMPQQSEERDFSEYQYYNTLFGQIQEPLIIQNDVLSYCMTQLRQLTASPQDSHKIKSLLAFFFIQLCQDAKKQCRTEMPQRPILPGSRYNQQYFLIEHYVNTHYHRKTSTEDIAAILHVSRRQADRIVEQVFGKTYATLITERRMSIAEVLLKKTDLSCAQIAEKVGYTSYPGFFLAFKQFFGIAPDALR